MVDLDWLTTGKLVFSDEILVVSMYCGLKKIAMISNCLFLKTWLTEINILKIIIYRCQWNFKIYLNYFYLHMVWVVSSLYPFIELLAWFTNNMLPHNVTCHHIPNSQPIIWSCIIIFHNLICIFFVIYCPIYYHNLILLCLYFCY